MLLALNCSSPADSQMKLVLDKQKLRWHDLILKLANLELHSTGEMSNWKSGDSSYQATVDGQINKFNDLNQVIETPRSNAAKRLVELSKMDIKGQANIELEASKSGGATKIVTKVDTRGLQIKPFLDKNAAHLSPMLKLLGLADSALLTGNLEFKPNEELKIVQGVVPIAGGEIKTSGQFDLRKSASELQFNANNIHLSNLEKNIEKASGNAHAFLGNFFYIPKAKHLDLAGVLNAKGTLSTVGDTASGEGEGSLSDALVALSDGSLNARKISGFISWHDKRLLLKQLRGTVGDAGEFFLDGSADLRNVPYVNWTIKAEHLDLKQLSSLMKTVRIQAPLFSESHLFGTVKTLDLRVVGPRDKPDISFVAVPENMFYQPPGLSRPLKSVSGVIVYKNDNLTLSDVAFVSHGDSVKTSFTIEKLSTSLAKLNDLSVKTIGTDLSDVHFYLSSCLIPKPLKKIYLNFLKDNKIFDAHGRISGDLACKFNDDKVALAGSFTLHDIQARVLRPDVLLKHIGGEIHIRGDDLVLQKVQGSYRESDVFVDGKVLKYAQDNPKFEIQLKASLKPDELAQLVPVVSDQMKRWNMNISSEHTVDVSSEYTGDNDASKIQFMVKADAGAKLSMTSQFGNFYQPKDEAVQIDGVVDSTRDGFDIKNSNIHVGNSILHLTGRLGDFARSQETTASKYAKYDTTWDGQPIKLVLSSMSPIAIGHVLSTLDPAFKSQDISGELTGKLVLEGKVPDIYPSGEVKISKLCIESVNVQDAQGTIKLLGKTAKHDDVQPIAKLRLPTLNVGPIKARDCDVDLALEFNGPDAALIKITEANAKVANGKADISGSIDLSHQKLNLNITLNDVSASKLTEELTRQHNDMTGTANVIVNVETHGKGWQQALDNLGGKGMIEMSNGSFAKLGHLETQLHRGNLLHQGILGFNMGNFLQSIIPTKTGVYNDLTGEFRFDKNEISVEQFKYNSNDMCLWSSGTINIKNSALKMTVAGKIPRISSGMVKDVSKVMSVNSFLHVATLGRLKGLPSLPILGPVSGANRSNTFEFKLDAPMDEPKAINQSAIKTFHWLPNLPTASAHPVLMDVN